MEKEFNTAKILIELINEYVIAHNRLLSLGDLAKISGLDKRKCRRALKHLIETGYLKIVYDGKGKPTIFAPSWLFKETLSYVEKPQWFQKYEIQSKKKIAEEIRKLRSQLLFFESIESMLYASGITLENSIALTLKFLEFSGVKQFPPGNNPDIELIHNGSKYVIEVVGTRGQVGKDKIMQLVEWVTTEIARLPETPESHRPSRIIGLLVINHSKELDPAIREAPLTKHAKELLLLYRRQGIDLRFITTCKLFHIVCEVLQRRKTKEEARNLILEGEELDTH